MQSVHQTTWFGSVTSSTTGNGKKPGATRTFSEGPFSFVEELFDFTQKECGEFTMKYIQHDGKLPFLWLWPLPLNLNFKFPLPSIFLVLHKPTQDSGTRLRFTPVERIKPPSTGTSTLASRLTAVSVPPLNDLDL